MKGEDMTADRPYGAPGGDPGQHPPTRPPQPERPPGKDAHKHLIAGPILMILGVALCAVGVMLPWNPQALAKGEAWNGVEQAMVNIEEGRIYGWLMVVAFGVAAVAGLLALIAAALAMTRRAAAVPAVTATVLGLVATLGVLSGYVAMEALDESTVGMWLYGASFLPVLIGAVGVAGRRF